MYIFILTFTDIEEIKHYYAEFYEDELLIEKQKNKLVKELKELIKKENITSQEDEENNYKIQEIALKIQKIQDVLRDLETEKKIYLSTQSSEIRKILKELETNFKKNEKQKEIDNLYLELLENLKA